MGNHNLLKQGEKLLASGSGLCPQPFHLSLCDLAHLVQLETESYAQEFIGLKQNIVKGKALWIV